MEVGLANRSFYATFADIGVSKARESFADYYGREPEVVIEQGEKVLAGPVSKEEMYDYRSSCDDGVVSSVLGGDDYSVYHNAD